jgi:phage terminase large subunit
MNHITEIYIKLFKRGEFSFITDSNGKTFEKQKETLKYLCDNQTTELMFGGGAGGSKSYTGWMWITMMALSYDETHYFIARNTLKDLMLYGMQTFSEVKDFLMIERDTDYKINGQYNYIEFKNKSKIYLLECKKKPSDTDFHGLGSSLFTSGFIEEAGEVHFDAYDTLCSRVNRWKNDKYGLLGKIFITCNPAKNWLYTHFYKKNLDKKLPVNQKYIPALAKDNPYCPAEYIERLNKLNDPVKRARLYLGEWDADDDPSALCDYDAICDLFTNTHVQPGVKRISADLAMQGRDKFIAGLCSGLRIKIAIAKEKSTGKSIEQDLTELKNDYGVGNSNIVADSDGLGSYLSSYIQNIKTFHGGASPRNKKEYNNLKSECGFKLSEFINKRELFIEGCTPSQQEEIIKELSMCLKRDNVDNDDSKKKLIPKERMKDLLGHSPDYLDMLLMYMIFYVKEEVEFTVTRR